MKTTLAHILMPRWSQPISELAVTLQFLLRHAEEFSDGGRWGASGPAEYLINYGGCTNAASAHPWPSGRLKNGLGHSSPATTWLENRDCLRKCILAGLCLDSPAALRWRAAHGITLDLPLKIPLRYQNELDEQVAWDRFNLLHGYRLPGVSTLNRFHRGVNVLCSPELIINASAVTLKINVTTRGELRSSPRCHSSWDLCSLLGGSSMPRPKWNLRRETFAAFVTRATEFYKTVQAPAKL